MVGMEKSDKKIIDGGYSSGVDLSPANNFWKKATIILALLLLLVCAYIGIEGHTENEVPENTVRYHLAKFVIHMRTVSMDPVVTRGSLEEAYAFTTLRASKQLDRVLMDFEFVEKHAEGIVVTVSIKTVIRKSKSLYAVTWTEAEYKDSKSVSAVDYDGFFKLKFMPIRVEDNFFPVNPSGVYIDNIVVEKSSGHGQ